MLRISFEASSYSSDVLAMISAFLLALLKEAAVPAGDLASIPPPVKAKHLYYQVDSQKTKLYSRFFHDSYSKRLRSFS